MASEQVQEYLEALFTLTDGIRAAKTTEIARHLKLSPPSVTEMMQKLVDDGYIKYKPYHGATLTDKGLKIAKKISRKHRLLERFLYNVLKIRKSDVHEQACKMEHTLSDEAEEALCKVLEHPEKCPDDGKPIPKCEKPIACEKCLLPPLAELKNGELARIVHVEGGRGVRQKLSLRGLRVGKIVRTVASIGGPVTVEVDNVVIAIGRGMAEKVRVVRI
ncbi:MAG: metal-dependent transcriptional regulator [Candidatus Thermoplasmatota archaeon]